MGVWGLYSQTLTNVYYFDTYNWLEIIYTTHYYSGTIHSISYSTFVTYTYVYIRICDTRSSGHKLIHNSSLNNKQRNYYFVRICRLWNSLPIIDLNLPANTIKGHLKSFLWDHFTANFNSSNVHTFHFVCPCSNCSNFSVSNFSHFNCQQ